MSDTTQTLRRSIELAILLGPIRTLAQVAEEARKAVREYAQRKARP